MNKKNRNAIINLLLTTIFIFIVILIGLKIVSGNMLSMQNIIALLGFSLVLGVVSTILYFYHLRFAFTIFGIGILAGLIQMYRSFYNDPNGWGDLAGLASLFVFILFGFGVGLLVQLVYYLSKKIRNKSF